MPSFFQLFSGFDALPSGAQLDQYALAIDTRGLVQLDEVARFVDAAVFVEAEARVDLGRDAAWISFKISIPRVHEQLVHEGRGLGLLIARLLLGIAQRFFHQVLVLRLLRGLEQERRVGGRVLRLGFADGFECRRCRLPRSCTSSANRAKTSESSRTASGVGAPLLRASDWQRAPRSEPAQQPQTRKAAKRQRLRNAFWSTAQTAPLGRLTSVRMNPQSLSRP